jgi:hypothetical protein
VEQRKDPLQESGWHKWEWVAGPELVWMMIEAYEHTGDEALLGQRIIPTADAVIRFFDLYYPTNDRGELVMHPSQAVETWWNCTNPMPELAGLRAITAKLLAMPESRLPADKRAAWKTFAAKLAPLPVREVPGGKALAPATRFADKRNVENPELYAVFPFRLCSFERDNRDLGVNALKHRWDRGASGWRQDDIFMAYLGLTDEARRNVVSRARSHDKNSRFPAFWGPNYDWIPDQDHGGVLMKASQAMLMQTDGDKIFLLPAWPKEWNVSFKLHAPQRTTVECEYKDGRITQLRVTPETRRKDIDSHPEPLHDQPINHDSAGLRHRRSRPSRRSRAIPAAPQPRPAPLAQGGIHHVRPLWHENLLPEQRPHGLRQGGPKAFQPRQVRRQPVGRGRQGRRLQGHRAHHQTPRRVLQLAHRHHQPLGQVRLLAQR